MKLTLLVFVQDAELYVDRCLASVLGGDAGDLEVVAVNAGSADESRLVLDEWARRDARLVVKSVVRGSEAEAFNAVLQGVGGDAVGFLHARAVLAPGAVGAARRALEAGHDAFLGGVGHEGYVSPAQAMRLRASPWNTWLRRSVLRATAARFGASRLRSEVEFPLAALAGARTVAVTEAPLCGHLPPPEAPIEEAADHLCRALGRLAATTCTPELRAAWVAAVAAHARPLIERAGSVVERARILRRLASVARRTLRAADLVAFDLRPLLGVARRLPPGTPAP